MTMNASPEHLSSPGRHMLDRRQFLGDTSTVLGSIALASLLRQDALLAGQPVIDPARPPQALRPEEGETG